VARGLIITIPSNKDSALHPKRLCEIDNNCARPYLGDEGGVWLDQASDSDGSQE
jgi:hypothetical protein